jgi:hypothetical protein
VLLGIASVVLSAAIALAAGGTVKTTLSPDKVGKPSTLTVTATGPFSGGGGLPTAASLKVQKGFKSSLHAVPTLCTAAQANANSCPARSQVGTGNATATVSGLGFNFNPTVAFTLYLGPPQQHGDISSVVIVGTLQNAPTSGTSHATGRLFKRPGGGLELLFDKLPNFSAPSGFTVTLNSLQLSAGAKRSARKGHGKHKHKVTYALITNPSSCANGSWTGTFQLTFPNQTITQQLHATCRAH